MRLIKIRLFFTIFIFLILSISLYAKNDLSISLSTSLNSVYTKEKDFKMLSQPSLQFSSSLGGIFIDNILLDFSFNLETVFPSAMKNDFQYIGYFNFGPSIDIGYRGKIFDNDANIFYLGFLIGTSMYWAESFNSKNYFFYPTFKATLFSDIKFKNSFYSVSVFMPVEVKFIRSLEYSILAGIGIKIKFTDFI